MIRLRCLRSNQTLGARGKRAPTTLAELRQEMEEKAAALSFDPKI